MASIPAYMRIRQYVLDLVGKHSGHDERIMSERELCSKFGVSRPTARRALKELIEEGYLYVKPGLGMFINAGMAMNHTFLLRKSFTVMVIVGNGTNTSLDGFFMDILSRLCIRMKSLPVAFKMANLNTSEHEDALRELEMHNPDGILWVRPGRRCAEIINHMRKRIPVCVIGNPSCAQKLHVTSDYYKGGKLAAEWFLERKHFRPAFVGACEGSEVKDLVYRGWVDAFRKAGRGYDQELAVDMDCGIVERVRGLEQKGRMDGIFVFGSEYAAVDIALTGTDFQEGDYPLMMDENYFGDFGAKIKPTVKLMLFPPVISEIAADKLFDTLNNPNHMPDEIVSSPSILKVKD